MPGGASSPEADASHDVRAMDACEERKDLESSAHQRRSAWPAAQQNIFGCRDSEETNKPQHNATTGVSTDGCKAAKHPRNDFLQKCKTAKEYRDVDERNFSCNECSTRFATSDSLRKHMRKHKQNGTYSCDQCNVSFKSRGWLQHHIRMHSRGKKPFLCSFCGSSYPTRDALTKHARIHTGERPFVCKVCGQSFTFSNNLTTHMRSHTGERPYKCKVCGTTFAKHSCWKRHELIHVSKKPFACDQCDASFKDARRLKIHVQTHTGEKPYVCKVCGISYHWPDNLKRHMKKHAGDSHTSVKDKDLLTIELSSATNTSALLDTSVTRGEVRRDPCRDSGVLFSRKDSSVTGTETTSFEPEKDRSHQGAATYSGVSSSTPHCETNSSWKYTYSTASATNGTCLSILPLRACTAEDKHHTHVHVTDLTGVQVCGGVKVSPGPSLTTFNTQCSPQAVGTKSVAGYSGSDVNSKGGQPLASDSDMTLYDTVSAASDVHVTSSAADTSQHVTVSSSNNPQHVLSETNDSVMQSACSVSESDNSSTALEMKCSSVVTSPSHTSVVQVTASASSVCVALNTSVNTTHCTAGLSSNSKSNTAAVQQSTSSRPFVCKLCNAYFARSVTLERHMKSHQTVNDLHTNSFSPPSKEPALTAEGDKEQLSSKRAQASKKMCTKVSAYAAKQLAGASDSSRSPQTNLLHPQLFLCDQCPVTCTSIQQLDEHIRFKHSGPKVFSCPECLTTFTTCQKLNVHCKLKHSEEKTFACSECKASFKSNGWLQRHIKNHSRGQKPFLCSFCGASFSTRNGLTKHARIHTGEKPFVCKECGKRFTFSNNLRTHTRFHTGEKPYVCQICGLAFAKHSSWKRHERIHTKEKPYQCDHCHVSFRDVRRLKIHTSRVHVGIKPHSCKVCGVSYSWPESLSRHMKKHSGVNDEV